MWKILQLWRTYPWISGWLMWVLEKDKQQKALWKYVSTGIILAVWSERNNRFSHNSVIGGNSIWTAFVFLSLGFSGTFRGNCISATQRDSYAILFHGSSGSGFISPPCMGNQLQRELLLNSMEVVGFAHV